MINKTLTLQKYNLTSAQLLQFIILDDVIPISALGEEPGHDDLVLRVILYRFQARDQARCAHHLDKEYTGVPGTVEVVSHPHSCGMVQRGRGER